MTAVIQARGVEELARYLSGLLCHWGPIGEGQRLLLQLVLIDSLNFPICRPSARPKNAPKIWGKARRVQLGQGLI